MNISFRLCLLTLALLFSYPDLSWSAGFDCTKAVGATEKMICGNSRLSALDDELAAAYRDALRNAPDKDALKAAQIRWLTHDRNACADAACLEAAYLSRIGELKGNKAKAAGAAKTDAPGADGFAWILTQAGKLANELIDTRKFKDFLKSMTPAVKLDLSGVSCPLYDTVWEFLHGPPDNVRVRDGRFAVLSACRAHSCPEKAWMWFDARDRIALGAVVHYIYEKEKYDDKPSILLFSRQVKADGVPPAVLGDIKPWLEENGINPGTWRFVGADGKVVKLRF